MALFVTAICLGFAPTASAQPAFAPLPGANDLSCRPVEQRPPVVLVHGSGTEISRSFGILAPRLQAAGYCVFAANLGGVTDVSEIVRGRAIAVPGVGAVGAVLAGRPIYGVSAIERMADQLSEVVRSVRAATGANKVALVAHSTGGNVARQYLRTEGADSVDQVVTMGTPYRGTTWAGLRAMYPDLAGFGLSDAQIAAQVFGAPGREQVVGAPLLDELADQPSGVRFTAIASRYDGVITPFDTALLAAPGPRDRNVLLQDGCPTDTADHNQLLIDPRSAAAVLSGLAGDNRALPC